jgi:uncharacterized protein YhfF
LEITKEIYDYWNRFIDSNNHLEYLRKNIIDAWSFGNTPEMADDLLNLVLEGKKTATCSLLKAYQGEEDEIPRVGVYSIITDGKNVPRCVVFYTDTFIRKFIEIGEQQAFEEGEGDRTLAHWRKVHIEFFSQFCDFRDEEEILCERFKVVFK